MIKNKTIIRIFFKETGSFFLEKTIINISNQHAVSLKKHNFTDTDEMNAGTDMNIQ